MTEFDPEDPQTAEDPDVGSPEPDEERPHETRTDDDPLEGVTEFRHPLHAPDVVPVDPQKEREREPSDPDDAPPRL